MCVVIAGVDWPKRYNTRYLLVVAGECCKKSSPLLQLTAHEEVVCRI